MILFVSGTDTGVGKTVVTCSLARKFRRQGKHVGVAKPVATGAVLRGGRKVSLDALKLMRAAGVRNYAEVNPVLFDPPISPHLAARLARRPIDLGRLRAHIYNMERRYDVLLVEGIGGVATPLTQRLGWADLMAKFHRPKTILVASPKLGTLNHTLLSLAYLYTRHIACAGIVLSNYDPEVQIHRQNREELARLTGICVEVLS